MATRIIDRIDSMYYPDTEEEEGLYNVELNPDLTEQEIEEALRLYKLSRGIMIVTGMPGSGKDLWGNVLSWKLRRFFKDKKVFRDEKPRRMYGYYEPFDNITIMHEFALLVAELESELPDEIGRKDADSIRKMTDLSNEWLARIGEEKLKNSVLYQTEFWRLMHNRRPFSPMGILIGAIIKRWRHLDLLVIGTAPLKRELDAISCLPYVTHEVRCSATTNPDKFQYRFFPVRYVGTRGVLEVAGKPIPFIIDGGKHREELGGKRYFDLYVSKSTMEQSRVKTNL
ncbi:hypothetical protein ES704_01413 [subsurface metagenome]|jgi:hypothetical protein